jgi:ribosome-associated toxin RatA of RatAB toxin-antitoxin module
MRELIRTAMVNRPPERLYALVCDVRSYPQFVPGCTGAEVLEETEQEIVVRLAVRRGALRTHFTTRNRLEPPARVLMSLVDGPFRSLEGVWNLTPVAGNGCRIELRLNFEFTNALKAALITPLLTDIANSMVSAFVQRAQQLP